MQRIIFGEDTAQSFTGFGSQARIADTSGVTGLLRTSCMYIPEGGGYGRHRSPKYQQFLVAKGQGWVKGDDGETHLVCEGEGFLFAPGDTWEAGSAAGMTLFCCDYGLDGPATIVDGQGARWIISQGQGSMNEQKAAAQLERLLAAHDVRKWMFTTHVRIVEYAIPHSHPVLTLNARHLDRDDLALATFLHEQIHWVEDQKPEQFKAAMQDFRRIYPGAPVGYPEGAQDEYSTYLHFIICPLEYLALIETLGLTAAQTVFEFWTGSHYRWIYRTILAETDRILAVLRAHDLLIT